MILVGSTGARKRASASTMRRPSSSTTSSPSNRPQHGTRPSSTRTTRLEMSCILVQLPVRHPLREAVELEALHRGERPDQLLAERAHEVLVRLERVERSSE